MPVVPSGPASGRPPRGAVKSRRVRAPGRRAPLVPTVTRPAPASVSASFPEKGSLPSRPRGRANQTRTRLRPREPAQGPTASPPRSQRHVEAGTHEGSEHLAPSDLLPTRRRRERRFPSRQQPRASHSEFSGLKAGVPGPRPAPMPCVGSLSHRGPDFQVPSPHPALVKAEPPAQGGPGGGNAPPLVLQSQVQRPLLRSENQPPTRDSAPNPRPRTPSGFFQAKRNETGEGGWDTANTQKRKERTRESGHGVPGRHVGEARTHRACLCGLQAKGRSNRKRKQNMVRRLEKQPERTPNAGAEAPPALNPGPLPEPGTPVGAQGGDSRMGGPMGRVCAAPGAVKLGPGREGPARGGGAGETLWELV